MEQCSIEPIIRSILITYNQTSSLLTPQLLNYQAGSVKETNNYIFNPDDDMMQPLITEIL